VPLLSAQQKAIFDYYLESDYRRHRSDLLAIARAVYQQMKTAGLVKGNPERADCHSALIVALSYSQRFRRILKSKQHLRTNMHLLLTDIMARYLLEADWIEIAF